MRILFLEHLLPAPLDSGAKLRSYCTMKALASRHELMMLSFVRTRDELQRAADIREVSDRLQLVPIRRSRVRNASDALASLACGRSFIVSRDFRPEMKRSLGQAVKEFQPDVIHIDHLQMAQFVDFDGPYRTVLDQHNVESTIVRRMSETAQSPLARAYARIEWPKLQRFELDACGKCDLVLTVSDKAELQRQRPSLTNIESVPIGIDTDFFHVVERNTESKDILFLGTMYWPPNIECVRYFHREILPIVRRSVPDCTFTIAGQRPDRSVMALASDPGVRVTGYVDDVREIARECGVFIVPLQAGSGVRVKILNAMAMGLPVVSTSVGAEGIEAVPDEHILIADGPEAFAKSVVSVLTDPALASRIGQNARILACEKYSWTTAGNRVLRLYDERIAPVLGSARQL